MAPKRKRQSSESPSKKHNQQSQADDITTTTAASQDADSQPRYDLQHSQTAERHGIVDRRFYPPQISLRRCDAYSRGAVETPLGQLESVIDETAARRKAIRTGKTVVHWFKRDLRLADNRGLALASERAQRDGAQLVAVFLSSPQDYEAHLASAVRVDFEFRTLEMLKADLAELHIPLHVEQIDRRRGVPTRLLALCREWRANHVFCNIEYEVDELRREALLTGKCLAEGVDFTALHDTCVVTPGALETGDGKQFSVFSPWCRAWLAKIASDPDVLTPFPSPAANDVSARSEFAHIFEAAFPPTPPNKTLQPDRQAHFASLWPAGEHEAQARLERFLAEKASSYGEKRSQPAENVSSMLSVHLAAGTLSARSAVAAARTANPTHALNKGNDGIVKWISELGWRDFYKHVMAAWPFVCMNAAFKPAYATHIAWRYDEEQLTAWKQGRTGYPFVDAAMRQLATTGVMHNRARMVVASFLAKDLLLDWRLGEQFFMLSLADGDFASNNGGWGFSVGCGVDPQPYMRLFNPILQSEKFDPEGEYIRRWVQELADVEGKAIHDPYSRGGADVTKRIETRGYPRMMVKHSECRERALRVYEEGLRNARTALSSHNDGEAGSSQGQPDSSANGQNNVNDDEIDVGYLAG